MLVDPTPRCAAVLGSPIAHSRSPLLHCAAYSALGLTGWTYEARECTADALPGLLAAAGPRWVGFSVTMPAKFAALAAATECTDRAAAIGSANTLTRTEDGWRADNTDVDGVSGALGEVLGGVAPRRAAVLGAGGTAPAAVAGLAALGVTDVVVVARDAGRAAPLLAMAHRLGVDARHAAFGAPPADLDVLVSTVPADAAAAHARHYAATPVVLDAIYDPWPTPLASAVAAAGGTVVSGLRMLLHQAFAQVEQHTGRPAPREAMAAALAGLPG